MRVTVHWMAASWSSSSGSANEEASFVGTNEEADRVARRLERY